MHVKGRVTHNTQWEGVLLEGGKFIDILYLFAELAHTMRKNI